MHLLNHKLLVVIFVIINILEFEIECCLSYSGASSSSSSSSSSDLIPENHNLDEPYFIHNVRTNEKHTEYWQNLLPSDLNDYFNNHLWQFNGKYDIHYRHDVPIIDLSILSQFDTITLKCATDDSDDSENDSELELPWYQMCFANISIAQNIYNKYMGFEKPEMYFQYRRRMRNMTLLNNTDSDNNDDYNNNNVIINSNVTIWQECLTKKEQNKLANNATNFVIRGKLELCYLNEMNSCIICDEYSNNIRMSELFKKSNINIRSYNVDIGSNEAIRINEKSKRSKNLTKTNTKINKNNNNNKNNEDRRRLWWNPIDVFVDAADALVQVATSAGSAVIEATTEIASTVDGMIKDVVSDIDEAIEDITDGDYDITKEYEFNEDSDEDDDDDDDDDSMDVGDLLKRDEEEEELLKLESLLKTKLVLKFVLETSMPFSVDYLEISLMPVFDFNVSDAKIITLGTKSWNKTLYQWPLAAEAISQLLSIADIEFEFGFFINIIASITGKLTGFGFDMWYHLQCESGIKYNSSYDDSRQLQTIWDKQKESYFKPSQLSLEIIAEIVLEPSIQIKFENFLSNLVTVGMAFKVPIGIEAILELSLPIDDMYDDYNNNEDIFSLAKYLNDGNDDTCYIAPKLEWSIKAVIGAGFELAFIDLDDDWKQWKPEPFGIASDVVKIPGLNGGCMDGMIYNMLSSNSDDSDSEDDNNNIRRLMTGMEMNDSNISNSSYSFETVDIGSLNFTILDSDYNFTKTTENYLKLMQEPYKISNNYSFLGDTGVIFHGKSYVPLSVSSFIDTKDYYSMQILYDDGNNILMYDTMGVTMHFDCNWTTFECDTSDDINIKCIFGVLLDFTISDLGFSSDTTVIGTEESSNSFITNNTWQYCDAMGTIFNDSNTNSEFEKEYDLKFNAFVLDYLLDNLQDGIMYWDYSVGDYPTIILVRKYEMTLLTTVGLIEATDVENLFMPGQFWHDELLYCEHYYWAFHINKQFETSDYNDIIKLTGYNSDETTVWHVTAGVLSIDTEKWLDHFNITLYHFEEDQTIWMDLGDATQYAKYSCEDTSVDEPIYLHYVGTWAYYKTGKVLMFGELIKSDETYVNFSSFEINKNNRVAYMLWKLYDDSPQPTFSKHVNFDSEEVIIAESNHNYTNNSNDSNDSQRINNTESMNEVNLNDTFESTYYSFDITTVTNAYNNETWSQSETTRTNSEDTSKENKSDSDDNNLILIVIIIIAVIVVVIGLGLFIYWYYYYKPNKNKVQDTTTDDAEGETDVEIAGIASPKTKSPLSKNQHKFHQIAQIED